MKLTPYWWDQMEMAPGQAANHDAGLPVTEVDLLVVGGGFTGLSAALTAARLGKSVLVCDAGQMGLGASTRNGGICSAISGMITASLNDSMGAILRMGSMLKA